MDFFEHQDAARRKTAILVVYFVLAVLLIVAAVYLVAAFALAASEFETEPPGAALWDPYLFILVALGTLALIGTASLYKILSLSSGGQAIANMLGGRRLHPGTAEAGERRLLNIVEEMALASGIPVPPVFLLDNETGINAFAAGFTPGDAVIGVTRGGMERLSRDEMQGVIAHEFSHILNGDMRLNLRLMGILHGILVLALIGYGVLRSGSMIRGARRERGGGGAIVFIGLALIIIGYTGVFFAKLIKSAVSRQREFLGDASAVQFTRNPAGIAGALKKIGGLSNGSTISHSQAEQASHMFFGNALRPSFLNLMSTHPPLAERIRRLDPAFDGRYPKDEPPVRPQAERGPRQDRPDYMKDRLAGLAPAAASPKLAFQPDRVLAEIGTPGPEHVAYAAALLDSIPQPLADAAHEPFRGRAVILALLIDRRPDVRRAQLQKLRNNLEPPVADELGRLLSLAGRILPEMRLPLTELTMPALKELSPAQYKQFRQNVDRLIHADDRVSLFEFVMRYTLINHLDAHFGETPPAAPRYHSLKPVKQDCRVLLSALAHAGQEEEGAALRAFQTASREAGIPGSDLGTLIARSQLNLDDLDRALKRLQQTSPGIKKRILRACAASIGVDGEVTVEEAELLRVVADAFDCPMPPLLPKRDSYLRPVPST